MADSRPQPRPIKQLAPGSRAHYVDDTLVNQFRRDGGCCWCLVLLLLLLLLLLVVVHCLLLWYTAGVVLPQ